MQGIGLVVDALGKQRFKVSRLVELERIPFAYHSLSYRLLDALVEACDLAREIEADELDEVVEEVAEW